MTPREIKSAEKNLTAILKKLNLSEEEERKWLLLDKPDWVWIANGMVWDASKKFWDPGTKDWVDKK